MCGDERIWALEAYVSDQMCGDERIWALEAYVSHQTAKSSSSTPRSRQHHKLYPGCLRCAWHARHAQREYHT
jgi:hypothetical protein